PGRPPRPPPSLAAARAGAAAPPRGAPPPPPGQDARCAAAHAWVGLGRIVYVASSRQLSQWLADWGVPPPPVRALPINEVAPGVPADGPVPELVDEVRELHHRLHHGDAH
ncbi:hypothetical protein AB0K87_28745, partial [Streptomyces sp. NPDC053705]|uniref:hypothetical protein n=1 Tax=Streptomyces sp. NPDC053705 TaxID=3156668 RepID=UPI00343515E4